MSIALRIKELRKKKGVSQYRLAKDSGISQSFLSALEAGIKSPTVYTIEKICVCLGISLSEFFDDEPAFSPVPEHLRLVMEEARNLSPQQCEKLADFIKSLKHKQ